MSDVYSQRTDAEEAAEKTRKDQLICGMTLAKNALAELEKNAFYRYKLVRELLERSASDK